MNTLTHILLVLLSILIFFKIVEIFYIFYKQVLLALHKIINKKTSITMNEERLLQHEAEMKEFNANEDWEVKKLNIEKEPDDPEARRLITDY